MTTKTGCSGGGGGTHRAILLVGPTGSGKTPLGECLERKGLGGARCLHFDFGVHLRRAAESDKPHGRLTANDLAVTRAVLESGALLEDHQFHIARKILRDFLDRRHIGGNDQVVLNGLPRHVGQARDIESIVTVELVVELVCRPEVVLKRIRTNAGADRTGRSDDDIESITRRLATFRQRTALLVEHYRRGGMVIQTIKVGPSTTADEMWYDLE
ncbi:MAG: AAA family ATPase [Anaerolineaceae bacterium]|nr:AAA family ATPase [Anaerolineaceae bacterium]